jgi:hypothetical protein
MFQACARFVALRIGAAGTSIRESESDMEPQRTRALVKDGLECWLRLMADQFETVEQLDDAIVSHRQRWLLGDTAERRTEAEMAMHDLRRIRLHHLRRAHSRAPRHVSSPR